MNLDLPLNCFTTII